MCAVRPETAASAAFLENLPRWDPTLDGDAEFHAACAYALRCCATQQGNCQDSKLEKRNIRDRCHSCLESHAPRMARQCCTEWVDECATPGGAYDASAGCGETTPGGWGLADLLADDGVPSSAVPEWAVRFNGLEPPDTCWKPPGARDIRTLHFAQRCGRVWEWCRVQRLCPFTGVDTVDTCDNCVRTLFRTAHDVDECAEDADGDGEITQAELDEPLNDCHAEHARCENTLGSFECVCNRGYSGDGTTCVEADGCAGVECEHYGTCTDVATEDDTESAGQRADGTPFPSGEGKADFTCECAEGYEGGGLNRTDCKDVDACAGPDGGDAQCLNGGTCVDGEGSSFRCDCEQPFYGDRCESEPNPPADGNDADPPADGNDADPPADGNDADPPADGNDADPNDADGNKADETEPIPPVDGNESNLPADKRR
jgi:hypothetical protein